MSLGSFSLGSFSWSFSWTCPDTGLLGASWVVIRGDISPLIWVITIWVIIILTLTPLITTHEPPSGVESLGSRAKGFECKRLASRGNCGFAASRTAADYRRHRHLQNRVESSPIEGINHKCRFWNLSSWSINKISMLGLCDLQDIGFKIVCSSLRLYWWFIFRSFRCSVDLTVLITTMGCRWGMEIPSQLVKSQDYI